MAFDVIHSFVNIFTGGRSEVKVVFFIAYLLFLFIVYLALKNKSPKRLKWQFPVFSLLALYIYGLALQISFTLSNNISLTKLFVLGANGEISSSRFWHTHVAKGVIGQVLHVLNISNLSNIDAGGAYVGSFSGWLFLSGAVVLTALIIMAPLYFAGSFKYVLNNKNIRQKAFLIIAYAIASFSLIESSIDGGIFVRGFFVSAFFIFLFVLRERGKKINFSYYLISSLVAGVLVYIGSNSISPEYVDGIDITAAGALILLYNLIFCGSEQKFHWRKFTFLSLLFIAAWWACSVNDRGAYKYGKVIVPANQIIYYYDSKNKSVETLKTDSEKSISRLSMELHKNLSYIPITTKGVFCNLNAPSSIAHYTIVTPESISQSQFSSSSFISIKSYASMPNPKNWRTRLQISVRSCTPELLSAMKGEFEKSNINRYILIDIF